MILRELIIEEDFDGVQAISLVTEPAILKNFVHFNDEIQLRVVSLDNGWTLDLDQFWKYTAEPDPETIPTSHKFCKLKAGNVFHISEIRKWDQYRNKKDYGFIVESQFFKNFQGINSFSFNVDEQIYNCRHHLKRVRRLSEVPAYKQTMYRKKAPTSIKQSKEQTQIQFKVNKEKREIAGPALIPNLMIYRGDVGNTGQDGYVWLSKKTIKQIKEQYGFNRTLTIQHETNITGRAILLDSWIYPDEKEETFGVEVPEGSWFLRYKIIDEKLWEVIKDRDILGFSIEGMFNLKEPTN